MADYEFELPWPPTTNKYHLPIKMGKGVRCIKSPKVTEYQKIACALMNKLGLSGENIDRPVVISLYLHPPTNRKFDCSNFLKAYEDALVQCGFLVDDHWIEYGFIRKGEKTPPGKIRIFVDFK